MCIQNRYKDERMNDDDKKRERVRASERVCERCDDDEEEKNMADQNIFRRFSFTKSEIILLSHDMRLTLY